MSSPPPPHEHSDDRVLKLRLVLAAGLLGLAGFVLEVSPVGGAFSRVTEALSLQLPALGFLAYLSLAVSAAVGLHLGEDEGKPPPDEESATPAPAHATGEAPAPPARTPIRPEVQQLRMIITALGGYIVLKGAAVAVMLPYAGRYMITPGVLLHACRFGFFFMLIAWLLMCQALRWVATSRRWVRLQAELIGMDAAHVLAIVVAVVPAVWLVKLLIGLNYLPATPLALAGALQAVMVGVVVVLATARPLQLRRATVLLGLLGLAALLLTLGEAVYEWLTPS